MRASHVLARMRPSQATMAGSATARVSMGMRIRRASPYVCYLGRGHKSKRYCRITKIVLCSPEPDRIVTLSGERGAYAHGRQKGESDSRLASVDEYAIFDTQRKFVHS